MRKYLRAADPAASAGGDSAADLLRRIGVLLPDSHLTQAGALVFCPADRTITSGDHALLTGLTQPGR